MHIPKGLMEGVWEHLIKDDSIEDDSSHLTKRREHGIAPRSLSPVSLPLSYMAINNAQFSKKPAHLIPMLLRGNTYPHRVTARYAFPPNTVGTRKLDHYSGLFTDI